MSSFRAITLSVITAACAVTTPGSAEAQTCSISSTAVGPLWCSVTTTVRMTMQIPSLVGVTVTSAQSAVPGAIVHAGVSVKTNRSYAVQISRAPMDSMDPYASTSSASERVEWATVANRAALNDTPTELDALDGPSEGRSTVGVSFGMAGGPKPPGPPEPIRVLLTVVAP